MSSHSHKTLSIRESDYQFLSDIASLLQMRDKKRVSLCEAMNYLVKQAKDLKIKLPSEVKVEKR